MGDDRYQRCPACGKDNGLWRSGHIPASQGIVVHDDGRVEGDYPECEAGFEPDGDYGCSCGWEGGKSQLDGQPLHGIHPRQQRLTP